MNTVTSPALVVYPREWFYLDKSQQGLQKGPLPADILCRMLERGVGVDASTLCWKAGMEQWTIMQQVKPFSDVILFMQTSWLYLDSDGVQQGPCFSKLLLHKFMDGEVDGLTLVFTQGMVSWLPMSEVTQLKEAIMKIQRDEEEQERAAERAQAIELQQQVYVDGEGIERLMALPLANKKSGTGTGRGGGKGEKKSFVADDGVRYMWDETEQEWIEDEQQGDDDEEEDDEEEEEGGEYEEGDRNRERDGEGWTDTDGHGRRSTNTAGTAGTETAAGEEGKKKRKRKQRRPKKQGSNLWVYITGLPLDVTVDEVKAHFSKVGLIAISAVDQLPKIKLYTDSAGQLKGDCSICYNAEASVQMAVDVLHGGYIRPSHQVTVKRAEFLPQQQPLMVAEHSTGDVTTAVNKKHKPIKHQQVKVAMSAMSQALSWSEDDDSGASKFSFLKIVVLENMFTPSDFDDDEGTFLQELEEDIATECGKCGVIDKITVFAGNPRGIVVVKFSTAFAAQGCIKLMDGRYFGGKKVRCFFWDQTTDYTVVDVAKEERRERERIDEFGSWLEKQQDELPEEFQLQVEAEEGGGESE